MENRSKLIIVFLNLSLLIYFCDVTFAQKIYLITDSDYVAIGPDQVNNLELEMDSLIYIIHDEAYAAPYLVYYDTAHLHVAFRSYMREDTAYKINYWRSGTLKETEKYLKKINYFDLCYVEQYCENGTRICQYWPHASDLLHLEKFYCNGQKKEEFNTLRGKFEGTYSGWYENGNKKFEKNYFNSKSDGEWHYWKENSELEKIEIYSNGKLIETK